MKYSVNDLIFPKKLTKKAKNCKLRSTNSIHANVEIKYIDLYDWFADKTKKLGLNCQIKTVTEKIIQSFTCWKLDIFKWRNLKAATLHVLTPDIFRGYDPWHTTARIWNRFVAFWLNVFFLAWNSKWLKMNSSSFKVNGIFLTFAVYTIPRISWFASTREGTLGVGAVCIIVAVM